MFSSLFFQDVDKNRSGFVYKCGDSTWCDCKCPRSPTFVLAVTLNAHVHTCIHSHTHHPHAPHSAKADNPYTQTHTDTIFIHHILQTHIHMSTQANHALPHSKQTLGRLSHQTKGQGVEDLKGYEWNLPRTEILL